MASVFLQDVEVAKRYGVHRSTPWRWLKSDPTFPQPVTLSPGCTRWKLSQIEDWEASKSQQSAA